MNEFNIKNKIKRISIAVFASLFFTGVLLLNYFNYQYISGDKESSTLLLIYGTVFAGALLIVYVVNMFTIKNIVFHNIFGTLYEGLGSFFAVALIIDLASLSDKIKLDSSNISLLITASLTLLGFGLTSTAISMQYLTSKIKDDINNNKFKGRALGIVITFFFLFASGLIYSISSLVNVQEASLAFYKTIIFRALFFSSAQIVMIIIELAVGFVKQIDIKLG